MSPEILVSILCVTEFHIMTFILIMNPIRESDYNHVSHYLGFSIKRRKASSTENMNSKIC